TKPGTNVTMQTPPLSASRASTSSGTLRGLSQSARAEEWLKITGAAATSSASRIVSGDTCDRSHVDDSRTRRYTTVMGDEPAPLRAIVAKRLSRLTDATTHLTTESETIEEYCRRKNIVVVAETEDLDVS